jgi:branched-chain amino acid transport system substrate-binding protein
MQWQLMAAALAAASGLSGQTPYAKVGADGVEYNGPPSAAARGTRHKIGLFGPKAASLAAGLRRPGYEVVGISSEAAWGKASDELVKLVYDAGVIGVVATDRASAHLAEQIAVKVRIPVIAISGDRTLTSINIPWIFRLESGTSPEVAIRCFTDAAARAGANRDAIRAFLASGQTVAGLYSFNSTGELR